MKLRQALGEVLREERLRQGATLRIISEAGFMSYSFLSEIELGKKDVSSEVFESIACSLGVEPYELVIRAGMRMGELDVPDTLENVFDEYADLMVRS
jgi:transcriptional regulator with XRE-family HTH domain